jgi:hypothetical protein
MEFDLTKQLRRTQGRTKSDVANKLISMFLHELSRRVSISLGLAVSNPIYHEDIMREFGNRCVYCKCTLERDRIAVEHLEGMNRQRAGLHVPGNVAISCKRCNNEKRRDDQNQYDGLAKTGWESFLSHDGTRCNETCKSCNYWAGIYPDPARRVAAMRESTLEILEFRKKYHKFTQWADTSRPLIHAKIEKLYRDCQQFATDEIEGLVSEIAP